MEQRNQELFLPVFEEQCNCVRSLPHIPDRDLSKHQGNPSVARGTSPGSCTCFHWYGLAPPSWTSGERDGCQAPKVSPEIRGVTDVSTYPSYFCTSSAEIL